MLRDPKLVSAILVLREFSIKELARFSGLPEQTVYSNISRNESLFEALTKEETGQPGGQPKRYRIKSAQAARLRSEFEKLFESWKATQDKIQTAAPQLSELPARVAAAESALLTHFPEAENAKEKFELLELAKISATRSQREVEQEKPLVASHLQSLSILIRLADAELEPGNQGAVHLLKVRRDLEPVVKRLGSAGDYRHAAEVLSRTLNSPLITASILALVQGPSLLVTQPESAAAIKGVAVPERRAVATRQAHIPVVVSGAELSNLVRYWLDEAQRISQMQERDERLRGAWQAARRAWDASPDKAALQPKLKEFLNTAGPRPSVRLTHEQIQLLATMPGFYLQRFLWTNNIPIFRVNDFLDAEKQCWKYATEPPTSSSVRVEEGQQSQAQQIQKFEDQMAAASVI